MRGGANVIAVVGAVIIRIASTYIGKVALLCVGFMKIDPDGANCFPKRRLFSLKPVDSIFSTHGRIIKELNSARICKWR